MAKRKNEARFFGVHAAQAIASRRPQDVHRAFFSERVAPLFGELMRQMAAGRRPYRVVEDDELERVSKSRHHEGVCLIADGLPVLDEAGLHKLVADEAEARLLWLDDVGNPHNLGAILRSAAHFGARALIVAGKPPAPISGAAARVAQGGAEYVPLVHVEHAGRALERLAEKGVMSCATLARAGTPLSKAKLPKRIVFLLGSERDGLSPALRKNAALSVTIEGTDRVESLNVSNAAALLLFEHQRRSSS